MDHISPTWLCVGCAILTHGIFRNFEPERASVIFALLFTFPIAVTAISFPNGILAIILAFWFFFALHTAVLVSSVILYRISPFHPLAKYPGPFLHRISMLFMAKVAASGKQHKFLMEMHEKYGCYVRVGPNELSFRDVNALQPILNNSDFAKGRWYDAGKSPDVGDALVMERNNVEHTRRRKFWQRGFSTAALREYESVVVNRVKQLVDSLEEFAVRHETLDLSTWLSYFAFDLMGDLGFGGGFEMMRDKGDKEGLWKLIDLGIFFTAIFGHIPWITPFVNLLPMPTDFDKVFRFADERVRIRTTEGSPFKDIFHYLAEGDEECGVPRSPKIVSSDAALIIIGGSDTTASALCNTFYFLMKYPDVRARLREEIDATFPNGADPIVPSKHAEMTYLNAVINEVLRLCPPVVGGPHRTPVKGSGGVMVNGWFIPEGTSVRVHTYGLHHDPRYFYPGPDEFRPDRWLNRSSANGEKESQKSEERFVQQAFVPFSIGPAHCIGKNIAYMELRMVVCSLVRKFDMQAASGGVLDQKAWMDAMEDHTVFKTSALPVRLTVRSG